MATRSAHRPTTRCLPVTEAVPAILRGRPGTGEECANQEACREASADGELGLAVRVAVAADFSAVDIIMAHPPVPWVDSAISIATHKANVYIDLSGWSPKYFPPQLVHAAGRMFKHRCCSARTTRA